MIKLTAKGQPIWFNIDQIKYFDGSVKNGTGTDIVIGSLEDGPYITVTESPSEVARLITEYKQRQMRLQAAYNRQYANVHDHPLVTFIDELESEDRP